jgi:hypothetical protein
MSSVIVRRFWCWLPWVIIIIIIIWRPCFKPAPDNTFDANLIIRDDLTAAWAVTSNEFAGGHPDPDKPGSYWTGVLCQLGHAEGSGGLPGAELKFKKIGFYKAGVLQQELLPEQVSWINIVADVPGVDEPMTTAHYPLIDGSCTTDENGCEKCRRLDARLNPTAVLTYWQGPSGVAVEFSQGEGSFGADNRVSFDFKDPFSITCYDDALNSIAACTFAVGDIDEIRVFEGPGSPGGGVKQTPPWPGP